MIYKDKFKAEKDKLIDGFLTRIKDAENMNRLSVGIFSMCAAMGLTFDKERRKFINENFVNVYPINQTFKEFKTELIYLMQEYLRAQIT